MASYFITGTSKPSGLGLGLVKELVSRPASDISIIFAVVRSDSEELNKVVASSQGRVQVVKADVTDAESVKKAAATVEESLGGRGLDVVINNVGAQPFTLNGIETMEVDVLESTFRTNVTSAHLVTSAMLPLLRKGSLKKVVNVSSTVGSIALAPGYSHVPVPAYTITKAALNMLTKQYALSLGKEGFTVISISPGWVKTELGGGSIADLEVNVSVKACLNIINKADKESNGQFLDVRVPGFENSPSPNKYLGGEVPW
ncbi:short-chain dehydrogenase-like protein [Stachybotrys elegans]|uniref:Short-chain dehydrogenase-like protein n=1 Tax=Stachybotrys elegans TaxID=80388 RepID=A0A8K0SMS6_9HYPO|nr:short-chain dehydrogenase-like protein [Stachybotrys elegans]